VFERRQLFLAGRGNTITAANGFQLFATRTTHTRDASARGELEPLLRAHFSRVQIERLTASELADIVAHKHPGLAQAMRPVLLTFAAFAPEACSGLERPELPDGVSLHGIGTAGRRYSTRDLFSWCHRLEAVFRLQQQPGGQVRAETTQIHTNTRNIRIHT
jgi:midasin (ATPase involved in ribosome maturation)